jgi:hypothetical protein
VKSDDHYINFTTHFRVQTRENKGQTKLPFSQSQEKDNNKESLARQSHIKNCQIAAVAAKVRRWWCDGATASHSTVGTNRDDWDLSHLIFVKKFR